MCIRDRSALSVSTPFGTFAAGRTGGLSSDCGTYNILHGSSLWTSYYSTGNIYGTFILSDRMDNVLLYNCLLYTSRSLPH